MKRSTPTKVSVGWAAGLIRWAVVGRHTQAGALTVYVIEGSLEYTVVGMPTVTLKPGDVLTVAK